MPVQIGYTMILYNAALCSLPLVLGCIIQINANFPTFYIVLFSKIRKFNQKNLLLYFVSVSVLYLFPLIIIKVVCQEK